MGQKALPVMREIDVVIGLLSHHGECFRRTQISIDALVRHTHQQGVQLAIAREYGAIIPRSRNKIVDRALVLKAKYVLFIDSDMVFDEDALMRLLAHKRHIVSGLCVNRGEPYRPVVKMIDNEGQWVLVPNLEDGKFRDDVDGVGCAFLLIDTEVFEKVDKPWFAMPAWHEDVMGEDYYFCHKAKEAGYDICVDCSLIVGHIGEHVYTMSDYLEYKKQREEQQREKEIKSLVAPKNHVRPLN